MQHFIAKGLKCQQKFTRTRIKRRDKRGRSLSISLSFYSGIESANEIPVRHKEIVIINNWSTNIIPREKIDLPEFRRIPKEGHITDYSKQGHPTRI